MPTSSHRLPRALLLSVALHLGIGLWLWTRTEPEAPRAEPLQVPVTLQFTEVELPLPHKTDPPPPGTGPTPPTLRAPVPRSTRRTFTPVPEAVTSPVPGAAQGGVPAYFHILGRSILRHWSPEHYLAVKGLTGSFAWSAGAQKEVARVMSDDDEARTDDSRASPQARRALREQTKERIRTSRSATVRVLHDARGKVLRAWVVSSSHDPSLDVLAADGVNLAARNLPSFSPRGIEDSEVWMSLWQMELRFSEHAPEPAAGLLFDEEMTLSELSLPPGQHLYKRVRLLDVRWRDGARGLW